MDSTPKMYQKLKFFGAYTALRRTGRNDWKCGLGAPGKEYCPPAVRAGTGILSFRPECGRPCRRRNLHHADGRKGTLAAGASGHRYIALHAVGRAGNSATGEGSRPPYAFRNGKTVLGKYRRSRRRARSEYPAARCEGRRSGPRRPTRGTGGRARVLRVRIGGRNGLRSLHKFESVGGHSGSRRLEGIHR